MFLGRAEDYSKDVCMGNVDYIRTYHLRPGSALDCL